MLDHLVPNYLREIARYGDDMVIPFFGEDAPISGITSGRISEFGNWLKNKKGQSARTANKIISTVSQIMKYSTREGWIETIPYIRRLSEKGEKKSATGYELSDMEIKSLMTAVEESAEHVRIHDLKHTFGSRLARLLGFDAMVATRHKSKSAFLVYVHAAEREGVFSRVEEAFYGKK